MPTPTRRRALLVALLALVAFAPAAPAGIGAELAEWLARRGSAYADDLAGKGAAALARELDDLAAKAGADTVEAMVKRGGPGALALTRALGDAAPDAARLIAAHGESGALVIRQGGTSAVAAFAKHGDGAVRVLAAHGPVEGPRMLGVYGESLVARAASLTPAHQAVLRAAVPELERAAPAVRATFAAQLARGGDDFVVWVGKRWKPIGAAALLTVGTLSAYKVGDGLAAALPNPAANPGAYLVWWLPPLGVVALAAGAWVMRGAMREWLRGRAAALTHH